MPDGTSSVYTLPEAPQSVDSSLRFLKQLNINAIDLGLERIKTVLALLGNPQNKRPCIHVAGTNGKGSTCALLESIYRHNGYRTGLTVSPHLISPQERIQMDRQALSDEEWMASFMRIYDAVSTLSDGYLSYFEWVMAMAFDAFNRAEVDIAIIETGLGGRLDATNVIESPVATVLTSISIDHTERLGTTLHTIAREKAAIIRHGTPVITGQQPPAVDQTIEQALQRVNTAKVLATPTWIADKRPLALHNSVTFMTRRYTHVNHHDELELSLLGHYQEDNLALALSTVDTLETRFPTQWAQIQHALAHTQWSGRYQWVRNPFGGWLIIDGSHNEDGLARLAQSINQDCSSVLKPNSPLLIGLTLMQHRDPINLATFIKHLTVPYQAHCLELDFKDLPAMHPPVELACRLQHELTQPINTLSFSALLQLAKGIGGTSSHASNGITLITGSLYTAGHVLSQLSQMSPHHPRAGLAPSS